MMPHRNILVLSISQALNLSGPPVVVLLGGLLGAELGPSPALATLPLSLMVVGVALSTVPASALMRRIGRRAGFTLASVLAALAALLAALGVAQSSFLIFCVATLLIGVNGAFVQQYRFAAAESVPSEHAGRAVSMVLLGGILAGLLGPEVATRTMDLLPAGTFTGSFVSLAMLNFIAAGILLILKEPKPAGDSLADLQSPRPTAVILRQPSFLTAVLAAAVSYGVMTFVMTATPLYMSGTHGFALNQTKLVIQSHIVAMYLPSLFTGGIIDRFGSLRVMGVGVILLLGAVLIGSASRALSEFWVALVFLGVGWNLLFVGGTVHLTQSYFPQERFRAQAINDLAVFGSQAIASLSAGTVLFAWGWVPLNLLAIPFLAATVIALVWSRRGKQPQRADIL